tara:strand:+ start:903 stop:1205 length:303 start_codon:yes stop_codon:yes gene_type:complete
MWYLLDIKKSKLYLTRVIYKIGKNIIKRLLIINLDKLIYLFVNNSFMFKNISATPTIGFIIIANPNRVLKKIFLNNVFSFIRYDIANMARHAEKRSGVAL